MSTAPTGSPSIAELLAAGQRAHRGGELERAMSLYREVLAREPDHVGALNNLGVALKTLNRFAPAVAHYRRALALQPDDAGLLINLGNALRGLGELEEAEAVLRRALLLAPHSVDARNNLALVHKSARRWPQAIAGLEEVASLRPEAVETHFDLALARLQSGDLARGFAGYEWRWRLKDNPPRGFAVPAWRGEPLGGRTILVYAEQGFGDTIQFARYAPMIAAQGGRVVLECQPQLLRLFETLAGVATLVPRGEPLPPFDLHAALLSLPQLFGTTLETIPAPPRYLKAPADLAEAFRARLAAPPGVRRIGLAWAGKPSHKNDHNRSAGLAPFLALFGAPSVRWYSLQVGPRAADLETEGCAALVADLTAELGDFAASAALVESLDLVITVDTAPAHLAGALGVPVWLALPFGGEWRYLDGRTDCPWYPSMRLFQQPRCGDWGAVFRAMADELAAPQTTPR
jgi:tetratricopeptide (TPR) repeat protein